MLKKSLFLLAGISLILGGCAYEGTNKLPGVYRIDIQQGNVVDQDTLDQLRPGMPMHQVRFIMGTPIIVDPFHQSRWDYVYSYSEGGKRREQRRITLHFRDNKLDSIDGNVVTGVRKSDDGPLKEPSRTVEVPLRKGDGIFSGLFDFLPFIGDDGPKPKRRPRQEPVPPAVETDPVPTN
ncbi:MAG: outer membrane protein assembly factor BamE [Gammaproteobacteria bacterium]